MEGKKQLLSLGKPLVDNENGATAPGLACSPDHPPAGRSATRCAGTTGPSAGEGRITRCPDLPLTSPDHPITRPLDHPTASPDATRCRECLGAMAHRLAQPMTALRGGIELGLMGKRSAADYRSLLEQSLQLADGMANLIVSLRDLGESSAPCGPAQLIPLQETAAAVVIEMEPLAQSRDLQLQFEGEADAMVCANPERLRDALQSLLAWVIQNSAGGGNVTLAVSVLGKEACMLLSPPRLDLQYLQIKVLEEITTPGLIFSHAAKHSALGWAINQRLMDGLGGRLEILTEGPEAGAIRISFPMTSASQMGNLT